MGLSEERWAHAYRLPPAGWGCAWLAEAWPPTLPALGHSSVLALLQDVDTAFLMKADLETNVEALELEINFLKNLFEEVPAAMLPPRRWVGGSAKRAGERGACAREAWEESPAGLLELGG